ncbi:MSHA biogenesis protein MshP [Marinimicrobium sp. ABcell2]|uniref:MSHA biogenesis protein MshP n=1 Tax=Marinimicrobium sp. ABcell2 TaxID=3069751 RepID=UPI0027B0465D|nr:MSHA biogenesis protein MshP [Marinimicrobium sp. ABcell2]MDQ2075233.1 MSHA biogenesis protein MshP [Marinimicrobium sp. ABcell2]
MCLNRKPLAAIAQGKPPRRQGGFLMPVAIFIVVAMGLFALMLWRTTIQTNVSAVQELISAQAFYAAESGAQAGMSRLFYPDASTKSAIDNQCSGMGSMTLDFSGIDGLNLCQASITCACVDENNNACSASSDYSFYTLTSVGSCGSGDIRAERSVRVSAFMERE